MNTKKLQHISLALTLSLLALAGVLALLGAGNNGPASVYAQGPDSYETYYVAPDCTGAPNPCYTTVQAAVDAVDDPGDEIRVAAGTYTDVNNYGGLAQIAYISKTLTLRGGYNADFSVWDPDVYSTTLDAKGNGRVIYVTGDISPTIEGLRITGGDATGLGGGSYSYDNVGGGVYVVTATATISANTITDNVAGANDDDGLGGGVYLLNSDSCVTNNTIQQNDATTGDGFMGSSGTGGGLCAEGGAPLVQGNTVVDNQASPGSGFLGFGDGGGLAFIENTPTVVANVVRGNRAVGSGTMGTGGGIELAGCPAFTLTNNIVAENVGGDYGGNGIHIGDMSGQPSSGWLRHNTLASNRDSTGAPGLYVDAGVVGTRSTVTAVNTLVVDHDEGVAVGGSMNATVTVYLTRTLWGTGTWANGANWAIYGDDPPTHTIISTLAITGTPAFLSPGSGDYHIAVTSDAVDEGVDAGVATDIDGEPRDANPDIGADEAGGWGLQVVKLASVTDLYPGDTVTYTIAVTGAGDLGVTNVVLTDTLPTLQRPLNISPGCSIADPGYGGLVTCAIGDLDVGQASHITIIAQVTTTLPAILPQTMRNTARAAGDQAQNDGYADTILHEPPDCHARVNGAGPEYSTVQAAVDAASAGDTVWIAGTCLGAFERAGLFQQVYVTKNLVLRGGYRADFSAWNPNLYTTTLDADGQGRVVYVMGPANVTVEGLRLTGGDATGLGGIHDGFADAGGGLYAISATVVLSDSHVTGNVASASSDGIGGGVGVTTATLTLVETSLAENTASSAALALGYGGGLAAEFSTVQLERSRLEGNTAAASLPGFGGGAYFYESDLEGEATLWLSNTVSASSDWGQGGGLYVEGSRPFTLTNCVIADNRADDASEESGGGLWIDGVTGVLLHSTIARNRWDEGVHVAVSTTVAITNAIIVSHSVGIRAMEGSTVTVNGVLWHDNISDTVAITATVQVSNGITGDPAFAPAGYHITPASQALDNGVVSTVMDDMDGDRRPSGSDYDLGADEYVCVTGAEIDGPTMGYPGVYDFVATVSPVTATPLITYTWQATGQSDELHMGDVDDTVSFVWAITGVKSLTVTAQNCASPVIATHLITIETCPALTGVELDGPTTTPPGLSAVFTATVSPLDAAQPITYTWEATGLVSEVHSGGLSDTVDFTWGVTGAKSVTVTAVNECGVVVINTRGITVEASRRYIYLPLVLRNYGA